MSQGVEIRGSFVTVPLALRGCEPLGLLQESLGPFGPKVFPGVSPRVSRKRGVSEGVSDGVSPGPFGPRAPECPKSVPRVSPECQKGVPGHSGDTLGTPFCTLRSPGPEGPRRHPVRHSLGHPPFSGHSRGHSGEHFGPEGPERLL